MWPGCLSLSSPLRCPSLHVHCLWHPKEANALTVHGLAWVSSVGLCSCLIYQRTKLLHMPSFYWPSYGNVNCATPSGKEETLQTGDLNCLGQLWLCARFNALMLPEFYSQRWGVRVCKSKGMRTKWNAVSVFWPFLAKKLLTIKIKKFSIYATWKHK